MNFMEKLSSLLNERTKSTENGAIGYETSGKALVDLNFAVSSLRNKSEKEIIKRFVRAFYEDRRLAVKWLFFLRDARGGLGERRAFRVIIRYMAKSFPDTVISLVPIMADYGRFDDLLCLLDTPAEKNVMRTLKTQLYEDIENMQNGKNISLCAKWMPSANASSAQSAKAAAKLQGFFGLTSKEYRRMLSALRSYINVTETYMSSNRWNEIDYSLVSSKANLVYRNAFMLHDEKRRTAYLESARKNNAVMHAGVLMPHEIVSRYTARNGWRMSVCSEDTALETLWQNLPDTVSEAGNVLCVVDGSGSMICPVGGGVTALHVSNALGIYFAERLNGAYKDKFITFSSAPKYVDLSRCLTLKEKLELAFSNSDCSNTNIEATFDLILETAVSSRLSQSKLPQTVLIISDMEFDCATYRTDTETLFETIQNKFLRRGYLMPKLVFWNVNSRTNAVPVRENKLGVGLVSGFSVNVCRMVLSNELDPYTCLKNILDGERYRKVENCLCS